MESYFLKQTLLGFADERIMKYSTSQGITYISEFSWRISLITMIRPPPTASPFRRRPYQVKQYV